MSGAVRVRIGLPGTNKRLASTRQKFKGMLPTGLGINMEDLVTDV